MFNWILIFTILGTEDTEHVYIQGNSSRSFYSEKQCNENLIVTMNEVYEDLKTKEKQVDFLLSQCFFIPTLKKPGETS